MQGCSTIIAISVLLLGATSTSANIFTNFRRHLLQGVTAETNYNPVTLTVNSAPYNILSTPITPAAAYPQNAFQCNLTGDARYPPYATGTYPQTVYVPVGSRVRVIFANGNLNGDTVTQNGEPGVIVQQGGVVIVQQSGYASPIVQYPGSPIVQQASAPPVAYVEQETPTVVQQEPSYPEAEQVPPPPEEYYPPSEEVPPPVETPAPYTPPETPAPTTPAPTRPATPAPTTATPTPTTGTPAPTTPRPTTPAPTQTPAPTTQTPAPTTQTPAPTTQTPAPTTQTPTPTTQTPTPTTQTPAPTTPAPTDTPAPTPKCKDDECECGDKCCKKDDDKCKDNTSQPSGRKLLQDTVPGGPNNGLVEYVAYGSANTVPGFVVPNTQFGVPYVEFTASEAARGQTASFKGSLVVALVRNGIPVYPFQVNANLSPFCQVNVNFAVA